MKRHIGALFLAVVFMVAFVSYGFAADGDISINGKEIIAKLAKLEEGQNGLNRRIDDQGKRIDDLRSELKGDIQALGNRMNDLKNLMYVVLAGIFALIGFVIWDRRTALSPVVRKARELEERNDLAVRVLKEYARKEPKMAEVLRSLGLL
ncbi:MAG: hypothetical protein U5R49_10055 [Deltaproteobacteria bacterium]|nr:hypothetical protein [Deltaproteobacteria bacterium]